MHRRELLLALSCASVACHSTKDSPILPESPPSASSPIPSAPSVAASPPSEGALGDAGVAAAMGLLADGNNAFGLDVYGAARKGLTNVALSPLSISMALTMTWAGARGDTAAQMKRVLHAEESVDKSLDAETTLVAWGRDPHEGVTLRVANRLFGDKSYTFNQAYLDRRKLPSAPRSSHSTLRGRLKRHDERSTTGSPRRLKVT